MNNFDTDTRKFLYARLRTTQFFLVCCLIFPGHDALKFGNASCTDSSISLDIIFENNFEGVVYSKGNVFNPSCSFISPSTSEVQNITFSLPIVDCGTTIRYLNGAVQISNTIIVQKYRLVQTILDVEHNITCKLPYPEILENAEYWTNKSHLNRYKNNLFEVWMDFQLGLDILGKDVENKLFIGDTFSILIHLRDSSSGKALQVDNCWAHEGKNIKESHYILHIYDRYYCKTSDWLTEFNSMEEKESESESVSYAVIKAFKFPSVKNLFITCSVQVCIHSCLDYCNQTEFSTLMAEKKVVKRAITEASATNSFRNRYNLMKATVNVLKNKLMEINNNRPSAVEFQRRVSNSGNTAKINEVMTKSKESDGFEENYDAISNNFSDDGSNDSIKNKDTEIRSVKNEVYKFNVTNNVVVLKRKEFSFDQAHKVNNSSPCALNLKFTITVAVSCFIIFCLLVICIALVFYIRKDRKRHKINDFLLYRFY